MNNFFLTTTTVLLQLSYICSAATEMILNSWNHQANFTVSGGTGETELTLHRIPLMHNAFFLLVFCAEWDRYNISVKKKNGIFRHLPKG